MKPLMLFLLLALSFPLFCTAYNDVVYLNNGSVIHGTIVELQPEVLVKIQTADGNLFVFEMNEVSKITCEPQTDSGNHLFQADRYKLVLLKGGLMFAGSAHYEKSSIDIPDNSLAGGFVIGTNTSETSCIGLGMEYIDFANGSSVPIYLSLRLRPAALDYLYSVLDGGYQIGFIDNTSQNANGPYVNFGLGFRSAYPLFIEFTYRMIWSKEYHIGYYTNTVTKVRYNYLTLMLGLCF